MNYFSYFSINLLSVLWEFFHFRIPITNIVSFYLSDMNIKIL